MANDLKEQGIPIKEAADILGIPRSRFYSRARKSKEPRDIRKNNVTEKELRAAIKMACNRYPLYGYRRIRIILRR